MMVMAVRAAIGCLAAYYAFMNIRWASRAHRSGHYEWQRHFSTVAAIWTACLAIIGAISTGALQ
jgi:hypothetical protein